jgi:dual specificity MAP kinase phosphatase
VILDVLRDGKTLLGQLKVEGLTRRNACIFGRHPQCDVHLEHASISRHHAKLMLDSAGSLIITDMGSGNPPSVHAEVAGQV